MISSRNSVLWGCLAALLLPCCHPIQYASLPLDLSSGDCALVLGSDRSSLYEYGSNLLRGSLGYGGGVNCITYDAINQAYIEARKRIRMRIQQSATYSMHHLAPLPYCIWPHYPVLCITVAWMFDSCARAVDVRAKLRALALPGAGYSVQLIQNNRRRFHPW